MNMKEDIVIFGGCFNPPTLSHVALATALAKQFTKVVIAPCGERADKPSSACQPISVRRELVRLAFAHLPGVEIDYYDFDHGVMTTTYELQHRYQEANPEAIVWQGIGSDLLAGAYEHQSQIERTWYKGSELMDTCPFVIFHRDGFPLGDEDYPRVFRVGGELPAGDSTTVRQRLAEGQSIIGLVPFEVEKYIQGNLLYR